ncbi:MAG: hypothetical protein HQM06_14020 [Magnetococcales bacterium]|nr:hypothetical protein [Magnetococcales bacterium]
MPVQRDATKEQIDAAVQTLRDAASNGEIDPKLAADLGRDLIIAAGKMAKLDADHQSALCSACTDDWCPWRIN